MNASHGWESIPSAESITRSEWENLRKNIDDLIQLLQTHEVAELSVACDGVKITVQRSRHTPVASSSMMEEMGELIAEPPADRGTELIHAPTIGTFTHKTKIGEPFAKGEILGYIKAVNILHEVKAEQNGRLLESLVQEGEPVGYGDPLFRVTA